MKLIKMAVMIGALLGFGSPLNATVTINSNALGYAFSIGYTGLVGGITTSNVSALGDFTYTGLSNNGLTYNFNYSFLNNSVYDSRMSSFAFDTTPNISAASSTGYYSFASQNNNYPEGIGNVEICFTAVSNGTCTGNGGGLTSNPDQTGTGSFALTFAQQMAAIDLQDFAVRFQAISPTVGGSSSGVGLGSLVSSSVSAAPDPATWMTMLAGFGLVGAALRRREPAAATGRQALAGSRAFG